MISFREADILDRLNKGKTIFRWIFDDDPYDAFVTKEDDVRIYAEGSHRDVVIHKHEVNLYYRLGYIFAVRKSGVRESPYTSNGGLKDIFMGSKFIGKVRWINIDVYDH